MARADGRRWWSRSRTAEPPATGPWWVERGGRWVLRPGTPEEARPAVAECDAADTLTVRTPEGRLLARLVGPDRPVGDTERRWREALGAQVDDALRVVDPRGAVIAAVRPLPDGGTDLAVVDPFPRSAQGRRASARISGAEMARLRASGPWILRNGINPTNCAHRELVDHTNRTLITHSFPHPDDEIPGNRDTAGWDLRLECAPLPVSWAFALVVAGEILRSRAIPDRLPGM